MNLYVTTDELKTFLGISGSGSDLILAMLNKQATSSINGILGGSDHSLHLVTNEVHDACGREVSLFDPHVTAISQILDDGTEYTQDEDYDITNNYLRLENFLNGGKRKLKVSYLSGWNSYAMATITVTDYANIAAAAIITLGAAPTTGFILTRGTDWTAGTSNEDEASKIAAAIEAKPATSGFAVGNVVYVLEATEPQTATRTLAVSDAVRLAKSAGTLGNVDFPEDIRAAVMMLVSALYERRKNPTMKSYTIGSKTVSFGTDQEYEGFKAMLKPYMRVNIQSI